MAWPPSEPGLQTFRMASIASSSHTSVSGRPVTRTITTGFPVAFRAFRSSFWASGMEMSVREAPSPFKVSISPTQATTTSAFSDFSITTCEFCSVSMWDFPSLTWPASATGASRSVDTNTNVLIEYQILNLRKNKPFHSNNQFPSWAKLKQAPAGCLQALVAECGPSRAWSYDPLIMSQML